MLACVWRRRGRARIGSEENRTGAYAQSGAVRAVALKILSLFTLSGKIHADPQGDEDAIIAQY